MPVFNVQKLQRTIAMPGIFCYDNDTFMKKTYKFDIQYITCPPGKDIAEYIDKFIENPEDYPPGVSKIFIIPDDGQPVAGRVDFDSDKITENEVKQYLVNLGINGI
jgi:hypothetical protein